MPPTVIEIDEADDPALTDYVGLTDVQLQRLERPAFIVEGHLALQALLDSPYPVRSVLVSRRQLDRVSAASRALPDDVPLYVASQPVLEATVGFRMHRGVVACAERLPPLDAADLAGRARRVLVLEGVNDHENLGSLFRNAAAFGVEAVLLDPTCADPLYRRSVRVSLGHVLRVPFARLEPWPDALATIGSAGLVAVALTPDPAAKPIDDVARELVGASPPPRVALVLGAEGPGLSAAALGASTSLARIPMAPGVDSLNVATAAAVALHVLSHRADRAEDR